MFPPINKPTCFTIHSATLIYNIFSDDFGISHNCGIFVNDISDLLAIFTVG